MPAPISSPKTPENSWANTRDDGVPLRASSGTKGSKVRIADSFSSPIDGPRQLKSSFQSVNLGQTGSKGQVESATTSLDSSKGSYSYGITIGRLEEQLRQKNAEIQRLKYNMERYKAQRDVAWNALKDAGIEPPKAYPTSHQDRPGSPESVSSVATSIITNPHQTPTQQNLTLLGPHSTLANPTIRLTPVGPTPHDGDFQRDFSDIFQKVEMWATTFAIMPVYMQSQFQALVPLKQKCQRLLRSQRLDDLIDSFDLRSFLIAAVINDCVCAYLGKEFFQTYESAAGRELTNLDDELSKGHVRNQAGARNGLLECKAAICQALVNSSHCHAWIENEASLVTMELFEKFRPLVPDREWNRAVVELREVIRACFKISENMVILPFEWIIHAAQRGDRYDANAMIQRNPGLDFAFRPAFTQNQFAVRLSVAPAITMRDWSSGKLRVQNFHKNVVLLLEKRGGNN